MIEDVIKENTAAVKALTAAIAALAASLKDSAAPAASPCPPAAYGPASAAVDAPAPAPVTQPAPVVAPAAPMSFEQLRGLCIRAGQAGLTADVLAFLRGLGYSMLADLPQGKYGDLVQFLAAKGVK